MIITDSIIENIATSMASDGLTLKQACDYQHYDFAAINQILATVRNNTATDPLHIRLHQTVERAKIIADSPSLRLETDFQSLKRYSPVASPTLCQATTDAFADVISREGISFKIACDLLGVDYPSALNWLQTSPDFAKAIRRADAIYDAWIWRQLKSPASKDHAKQLMFILEQRQTHKTPQEIADETELRRLEIESKKQALLQPTNTEQYNFIMVGKGVHAQTIQNLLTEAKSIKKGDNNET